MDFLAAAQAHKEELSGLYHTLHRCPGTGFDLSETLGVVHEELLRLGYTPKPCGKAGLAAEIRGAKPGKVFLLRADMDGLPIPEETGLDFAAENGHMHACGHDLHTTMLLGAAKLLKAHADELCGTVKLMFQPAEEILAGAKDMIEHGVLENPAPDAALMIHVMAGMPFPAGTAIVSGPGVSAPAADYFEIRIQGRGCHGSSPHTGVDPITAGAHLVTALQVLHARELAITDRAALTIGTFQAGSAANVIPDTAVLGGTLRAFDEDVRLYLKKRLTEIAEATASAFRAKATVTFDAGCPTLLNDTALSAEVTAYLKTLLGPEKAFSVPELEARFGAAGTKTSGSEDFAYVSHRVPSIMLALAAGHPEHGYTHPLHHPKVRFDESVLPVGAAVYTGTAMDWLSNHTN